MTKITCDYCGKEHWCKNCNKIDVLATCTLIAWTILAAIVIRGLWYFGEQSYRMNEAKIRIAQKSAQEDSTMNIRFNKISM